MRTFMEMINQTRAVHVPRMRTMVREAVILMCMLIGLGLIGLGAHALAGLIG